MAARSEASGSYTGSGSRSGSDRSYYSDGDHSKGGGTAPKPSNNGSVRSGGSKSYYSNSGDSRSRSRSRSPSPAAGSRGYEHTEYTYSDSDSDSRGGDHTGSVKDSDAHEAAHNRATVGDENSDARSVRSKSTAYSGAESASYVSHDQQSTGKGSKAYSYYSYSQAGSGDYSDGGSYYTQSEAASQLKPRDGASVYSYYSQSVAPSVMSSATAAMQVGNEDYMNYRRPDVLAKMEAEGGNSPQFKTQLDWRRRIEGKLLHDADRIPPAQNQMYCLIHSPWLKRWRTFVKGGPPPGPISNNKLMDPKKSNTPLAGLEIITHYRAVTEKVYDIFASIYGGGPKIQQHKKSMVRPIRSGKAKSKSTARSKRSGSSDQDYKGKGSDDASYYSGEYSYSEYSVRSGTLSRAKSYQSGRSGRSGQSGQSGRSGQSGQSGSRAGRSAAYSKASRGSKSKASTTSASLARRRAPPGDESSESEEEVDHAEATAQIWKARLINGYIISKFGASGKPKQRTLKLHIDSKGDYIDWASSKNETLAIKSITKVEPGTRADVFTINKANKSAKADLCFTLYAQDRNLSLQCMDTAVRDDLITTMNYLKLQANR